MTMKVPMTDLPESNPSPGSNEFPPYGSASRHHQEALSCLRETNVQTVLAWVALLRSLQPGFQYVTKPGGLGPGHFDAVKSLLNVPDETLATWLQASRQPVNVARLLSESQDHIICEDAGTMSARLMPQHSFESCDLSSKSLDFWSPPSGAISQNTSATSWSQANSSSDLSQLFSHTARSGSSMLGGHTHWCTHCNSPRPIYTCDGWKRHMKEHETVYHCMPYGPVELSDVGMVCAFCHELFPDQTHLNSHNAQICGAKPKQYTRKVNLVNHLDSQHGISDNTALVERWRRSSTKKNFSCGFCVDLFSSLADQLNHIDAHFRQFNDISDWDFTKVILGLLLQPDLNQCWSNVSANYEKSGFSWNPLLSKQLQVRLELCEDSALVLAVAAFNESIYDDSPGDAGLTMMSSDQLLDFD